MGHYYLDRRYNQSWEDDVQGKQVKLPKISKHSFFYFIKAVEKASSLRERRSTKFHRGVKRNRPPPPIPPKNGSNLHR